jgi:hypothetical protein
MTACSRTTLTTTMWVINRIHDHTTNRWTNTSPAHCASFTNLAQVVLTITNFTDSGAALYVYATNFT